MTAPYEATGVKWLKKHYGVYLRGGTLCRALTAVVFCLPTLVGLIVRKLIQEKVHNTVVRKCSE